MANGEPGPPRQVSHVELKAWLLVALTAALVIGFAGYVLYARGVFEPTQTLYLVADNSEGVSGGADLTFSGLPIGRVRRGGGGGTEGRRAPPARGGRGRGTGGALRAPDSSLNEALAELRKVAAR